MHGIWRQGSKTRKRECLALTGKQQSSYCWIPEQPVFTLHRCYGINWSIHRTISVPKFIRSVRLRALRGLGVRKARGKVRDGRVLCHVALSSWLHTEKSCDMTCPLACRKLLLLFFSAVLRENAVWAFKYCQIPSKKCCFFWRTKWIWFPEICKHF